MDKVTKPINPPGWDGTADYYQRHYGLSDEIPVELPSIKDICRKGGKPNQKTQSRISRLLKGLNGHMVSEGDDDDDVAIIVRNQISALAGHQETLGQTAEGRAILEAVREMKSGMDKFMAAIRAIKEYAPVLPPIGKKTQQSLDELGKPKIDPQDMGVILDENGDTHPPRPTNTDLIGDILTRRFTQIGRGQPMQPANSEIGPAVVSDDLMPQSGLAEAFEQDTRRQERQNRDETPPQNGRRRLSY